MNRPDLHLQTEQEDDQDAPYYEDEEEDDKDYSDDDIHSTDSIDSNIDFSINYALHNFVATVEGQASVTKNDALHLRDDSNAYWWLVQVLKDNQIGYIPAEMIETPFERLARLNQYKNIHLAASTPAEKAQGSRLELRNASPTTRSRSSSSSRHTSTPEGIKFAEPTYVDHPGYPEEWNDDDETEEYEEEYEEEDEDEHGDGDGGRMEDGYSDDGEPEEEVDLMEEETDEGHNLDYQERILLDDEGSSNERHNTIRNMMMEPDDGMSWDDHSTGSATTHPSSYNTPTNNSSLGLSGSAPRSNSGSSLSIEAQGSPLSLSPVLNPGSPSQHQSPTSPNRLLPSEQLAASSSAYQAKLAETQNPYSRDNQTGSQQSLSNISAPGDDFLNHVLEAGETRKIHATPPVARLDHPPRFYPTGSDVNLSETMSSPDRKRMVSDGTNTSGFDSPDEEDRKESADHGSLSEGEGGKGALKKPKRSDSDDGKKKSGGVFVNFFKKKDRKDKGISSSTIFPSGTDSNTIDRSSSDDFSLKSTSGTPQLDSALPIDSNAPSPNLESPPLSGSPGASVSPHALRLQQKDQEQQARYQKYLASSLKASPDQSPPSLSYGTQAAAAVAESVAGQRMTRPSRTTNVRPGSLLIASTSGASNPLVASDGSSGLQMLSVLRVFAGQDIQSDSTFKTVLLNENTTTSELLHQAIQRFRLGTMEKAEHYVLTVKGIDGEEIVLGEEGHPLVVFNRLQEEDESLIVPKVRRGSVGSISSVSSNLSLNPAIARLGDYSDDSQVKLYLNQRTRNDISALSSTNTFLSAFDSLSQEPLAPFASSTPNGRFTLQIAIYAQDLPDDLVFDPNSEAVLSRSELKQRNSLQLPLPSLSSPTATSLDRKRYILLPTNTTAAEAIEVALERYGISEGVVDGGDDVEDKLSKRRSAIRVRYGLAVRAPGQEEEYILNPSSKVISHYTTSPNLKSPPLMDLRERRRSREVPLATPDDLLPTDPVFILRRAPKSPGLSPSKRRSRSSIIPNINGTELSRKLSVESRGDDSNRRSVASTLSVYEFSPQTSPTIALFSTVSPEASSQPSKQEIITAQRAASKASQLAVLSASANASLGVDVVLSNKGTVRSSRSQTGPAGSEEVRYSYIAPDGATVYDISELVEQEWTAKETTSPTSEGQPSPRSVSPLNEDVLEVVLTNTAEDCELDRKIDRVLQKVRDGNMKPLSSALSESPSHPSALIPSPENRQEASSSPSSNRDQPSVSSSSVLSRSSPAFSSSGTTPPATTTQPSTANPTPSNLVGNFNPVAGRRSNTMVTKDDFGMKRMLAVINARAREPPKNLRRSLLQAHASPLIGGPKPNDEVENLIFGEKIWDTGPAFDGKQRMMELQNRLEDFDKELDRLMDDVMRVAAVGRE